MLIGIGGISRSGKSSLAQRIQSLTTEKKVAVLSQDDFVYDEEHIPKIKGVTDWECPESIDIKRFETAIIQALKTYDIVIAEGLLIFYWEKLNSMYDKRIFIDIDETTFYKRKARDERWGTVPNWYNKHIWDSYVQYGKINSSDSDCLLLDGRTELNFESVKSFLGLNNS